MADDLAYGPMSAKSPTGVRRWWPINRRTIQIALGVIWIIDAGLKFQPKMFGSSFATMVVAPMAQGQPAVIGSSISHMAHFLSHEGAMWVTIFGLIELAIGVGLLFPRTVKPALVGSFIWAGGIWWFGEGFGGILTGQGSPLTGVPGTVIFYALLGAMVWPTSPRDDDASRTGVGSSVAARGLFGTGGALAAWAVIWGCGAFFWLLPANRTSSSISSQMTDAASGEPGWYAHFLRAFGHAFAGAGTWISVILAIVSLAIALGPLITRRATFCIGCGMALALLYWVTGEAVGEVLTGMGTDPNNGLLIILIGLAVLPMVPAPADAPAPAAQYFSRHPAWTTGAVALLVAVPLTVAAVPTGASTASAASSGSGGANGSAASTASSASTGGQSMSGMSGMSGMRGMGGSGGKGGMSGMDGSGGSGSGTHATKKSTMNMSGMAGLGVTDPTWHYTGPPLPKAEVALLTASSDTQDKGHAMQTPSCTTAPSANQVLGATQYVQAVTSAVAKYKVLSVAKAAGYIPITDPSYPVVHYLNPAYFQQKYVMDPNHVDSLVYATTPNGPVLVAAMFLLPRVGEDGPMPYGCLVQWHAHTNLCYSKTTHVIVGFTPCSPGEYHAPTPYMTHVWQVPVAGGPLAIDPSDLQTVEAAIQAQQQGLAPITASNGTVSYASASGAVGAF